MVTIRSREIEAHGDGQTSCVAAFQQAANKLRELGGGRFDIDDGDYLLDGTVTFDWDNIRVVGNGRSTRILNGTADKPAIILGAESAEEACSGCAAERI